MRRSAIVYCRRTPLASATFSSTRVIPEITPSTCSKRPSLAADAARSISAARRSPTVGDVLLRSRSASTSTAPGGSATRPVGVARAPGGRTASCTAAGGGPGWEGGGAGGEAEGGGVGAARGGAGLACRSLESDSSSSAPLSLRGDARSTTPGSASAALGGGGSCVTRGTPSSGTDLMSRMDSRSEEHTSELQSRLHLVCRLLLEKKKLVLLHPAPRPQFAL